VLLLQLLLLLVLLPPWRLAGLHLAAVILHVRLPSHWYLLLLALQLADLLLALLAQLVPQQKLLLLLPPLLNPC
jgi:hypothetical protein